MKFIFQKLIVGDSAKSIQVHIYVNVSKYQSTFDLMAKNRICTGIVFHPIHLIRKA